MAFDLNKVSSTNSARAYCSVIHSPGGVGKTTFGANAALADNGLVILFDDSLSPLGFDGVKRQIIDRWGTIENCEGYKNEGTSFHDVLTSLMISKHNHKVIIVDTYDDGMPLLDSYVVNKYYKGDTVKANAFKSKYNEFNSETVKILNCFKVLQEKGINIIVMVHSVIMNHKDPSNEPYQRWSLNLPGGVKTSLADLLYNYADNCLFANYDVVVKDGKGVGMNRIAFTEWSPAYDAKNRYSLPPKITFDYKTFRDQLKKGK